MKKEKTVGYAYFLGPLEEGADMFICPACRMPNFDDITPDIERVALPQTLRCYNCGYIATFDPPLLYQGFILTGGCGGE